MRWGSIRTSTLLVLLLASLVFVEAVLAHPGICGLGAFNAVADECQLSTAVNAAGPYSFDHTFHILPTGRITVPPLPDPDGGGPQKPPANNLTLTITGDGKLLMDTGAAIIGDVTAANGTGATIIVNAQGDIFLAGNGTSGARITSSQNAGSCTGGNGGSIFLTADTDADLVGDVITQPGSAILSSARCPAGTIKLKAVNISVDGLVQSRSAQTGTGAIQPTGGGPVFLDAGCDLTITPAGVVSSQGSDAGADLVHLVGGCDVRIFGLVESTGKGSAVPNASANHCREPFRPGKPANSVACVEVWGGTVLIQSDATTN